MKIGLIGNAGSGKDTIADYLVTRHGYAKVELKGALHQTLMVASTPYANAVYLLGYEKAKRETSWVRPLLVETGQEMKRIFGEDIFVRAALEASAGLDNVVVSDVRFAVEVRELAANGFVFVEVCRHGADAHDSDEAKSEAHQWGELPMLVNDGTIEELHQSLDAVLNS